MEKPANTIEDLSRHIEKSVKKEPMDRVRCVRVFDDYYRCNWWSPNLGPANGPRTPDWTVGATHFVRKSSFFKVTSNGDRLVMEERQPATA